MIVRCESQNDNRDYYIINDANNLDELKNYADKNLPIKCLKISETKLRRIFLDIGIEVNVYLNNYLWYSDVTSYYYLMSEDQAEEIEKANCTNCYNNTEWAGCFRGYKKGEGMKFFNYKEKLLKNARKGFFSWLFNN